MSGDDPEAPPGRPSRRTIPLTIASVLLAAGLLGWVLPRLTGVPWSRTLAVLGDAGAPTLLALVLLAVLALVLQSVSLCAAAPGLRARTALPTTAITTALAVTVPGGSLLGLGVLWRRLRRAGSDRRGILAVFAVVSGTELAVALTLAPLGALALTVSGSAPRTSVLVAAWVLAGVALLVGVGAALVLRRDTFSRLVDVVHDGLAATGLASALEGRWSPSELVSYRDDALGRLRARPLRLLLGPIGTRVAQGIALAVALGAVGLDVPLPVVIAVFVLGRLLASVPVTPGGAGIAETGSAAALIALGFDPGASVAAALLVTVTTLLAPAALGLVAAAVPSGSRST